MGYKHIQVPSQGDKITVNEDFSLNVPDNPIIPYIEGDGIGVDISPVMIDVVNAAVEKAYGGRRKFPGWKFTPVKRPPKCTTATGSPKRRWRQSRNIRWHQGPLTTPVGGGFRSLNVALRQELDLYTCLRPVRWFEGVPSPVKDPGACNMVIFRENSEDIYAGVEYQAGTPEAQKVVDFIINEMGATKIRFPQNVGIGIKPVSEEGTKRLVRKAIQYAIDQDLPSVTLVHKGNIMKFTEGAFRDWGYELAQQEFGGELLDGGPWVSMKNPNTGKEIVIKDVIADAMLQQILTRPKEYSVVATLNLNGDYLSDALAAQVGGIGIAPGANLSIPLPCLKRPTARHPSTPARTR